MSVHARISPAPEKVANLAVAVVRPRSLAIQVARRMVLWACINTLILTAIGYIFVSERAEQRTLAYLRGYLTERLRAESQVFEAGQMNLAKFETRFLSLYKDPKILPEPRFNEFFEPKPDGSLRLRERFYTGSVDGNGVRRDGTTGFVAVNRPDLPYEFKRRMVLAYQVIADLGPAWNGSFANLYAGAPENAGVVYWPGMPWGLRVSAKQKHPQAPYPAWSPLYFDPIAKRWNVSYYRPVYYEGRPILYPGEDIMLDELMSRLISDHPAGAYNLILGKGGDLIAHPERIRELKHSVRGPKVASLGDPVLESIYRGLAADARRSGGQGGVRIIENREADAYVCYGELAGPGWWFVTVYPRALVLQSAHEAANGLLLLGILSFTIMTLIVIWVLRDRVGRPISLMKTASEKVSSGDYDAVASGRVKLPEDENNEIGVFAQSFKSMARKIDDTRRNLEETVFQRTRELQSANRELEKLSYRDGLTGAGNRRSFDRDIAEAIEAAHRTDETIALVLCDVDYFKLYNDTYGHPEGDQVLRLIAEEITRLVPSGRLYRYGGEELALIVRAPGEDECRAAAAAAVIGVAALSLPHEKSPHGIVTISAGLTVIRPPFRQASEAVAAADARLYRAKSSGRNQLIEV